MMKRRQRVRVDKPSSNASAFSAVTQPTYGSQVGQSGSVGIVNDPRIASNDATGNVFLCLCQAFVANWPLKLMVVHGIAVDAVQMFFAKVPLTCLTAAVAMHSTTRMREAAINFSITARMIAYCLLSITDQSTVAVGPAVSPRHRHSIPSACM